MAIVPKNPADQIQFYDLHVPKWSEDPGSIGLTGEITADLATKLEAARAAYEAALAIRTQAEAATLRYRNAVRQLHDRGGAAIATIKAFAEVTDDIQVYIRASIQPPRTRGPARPAPGQPVILSATVSSMGTLNLVWKAAHRDPVGASSGIYFEILRCRNGMGETQAVLIGTTAGLDFRDPDIGPGENTYFVRARRGRNTGPLSVAVSVNLPTAPPHTPGAIGAEPSIAAAPRPLRRAA